MSTLAPGIVVNGVKIDPELIDAEVQYHPSQSLGEAKYAAMQALVIRELLLQRSKEIGGEERGEESDDDSLIANLLEKEVICPEPDEEELQRYYEQNRSRFITSPLFEASHILYLAPLDIPEEREKARANAKSAIARLIEKPDMFSDIAKAESACSSKENGGHLGQISRGQTMPDFEKVLFNMAAGELTLAPVETPVGFHVIKVHYCENGKEMPFEMVRHKIAEYLKERSWNMAFRHYIQFLIGRSQISGFRLLDVDSPLLQ